MRNARAIEQAQYVATMAAKLAFRVESREAARHDKPDTMPLCGYGGIDSTSSGTNIDRMITQLRLELLELRRLVQDV